MAVLKAYNATYTVFFKESSNSIGSRRETMIVVGPNAAQVEEAVKRHLSETESEREFAEYGNLEVVFLFDKVLLV